MPIISPGRIRCPGYPVLDVSSQIAVGGEQGLLGLAFSPDGRFLYVDVTDRNGDTHGRAKANTGWIIGTRRSRRNRGHASPTSRTTAARAGGQAGPRQPAP